MKKRRSGFNLFVAIFFVMLGLGANLPSAFAQDNPNTITFDNKSGESALVKLMGPTMQAVEVPNGEGRTINAAAGEYYILTRYGSKPGGYKYTEGDPFTVVQTESEYSIITITLHPVIGGNYATYPISADEFEKAHVAGESLSPPQIQPLPKIEPLPPRFLQPKIIEPVPPVFLQPIPKIELPQIQPQPMPKFQPLPKIEPLRPLILQPLPKIELPPPMITLPPPKLQTFELPMVYEPPKIQTFELPKVQTFEIPKVYERPMVYEPPKVYELPRIQTFVPPPVITLPKIESIIPNLVLPPSVVKAPDYLIRPLPEIKTPLQPLPEIKVPSSQLDPDISPVLKAEDAQGKDSPASTAEKVPQQESSEDKDRLQRLLSEFREQRIEIRETFFMGIRILPILPNWDILEKTANELAMIGGQEVVQAFLDKFVEGRSSANFYKKRDNVASAASFFLLYIIATAAHNLKADDAQYLLSSLQSPDDEMRIAAAELIGSLDIKKFNTSQRRDAVKTLTTALQDRNKIVRMYTAISLGEYNAAEAEEAIPILIKLLDDEYDPLALSAASTLGRFGLAADIKSDKLIRRIKDSLAEKELDESLESPDSIARDAISHLKYKEFEP